MKCIKCKKKIPDDSKFCNYCGTKQKDQKMYRRPDGLYEKVVLYDGKRKAFRGQTIAEVNRKIALYNPTVEKEKAEQFIKIAEAWEEENFPNFAHGTLTSYRPKLKYAIEYFGKTPISEINTVKVNKYLKSLPKTYAYKTVMGYLSIVSMILSYACRIGLLDNNPCTYIKLPKNLKRTHRRAPTTEEINIINNNLNLECGVIAYFFLYSGLRRGEALALTWGDIDFKKRTITVNKSVYWDGNTPHLKKPKTEKGNRTVVLLDCLAEVLQPLKKDNNTIVFNDNGELYKNSKFERMWKRYQEATGLTEVTPHIARHGFSSMCFDAEIQIKDVQELMGHAQYSTTADIYTHISQNHKKETLKKLNQYINNSHIIKNTQ